MIPVVETERLILREPRVEDFETVAAFLTSARSRMIGGPCERREVWGRHASMAGQWLLRGYGMWMIEERASGRPVGRCGVFHPAEWIEPELGWSLFAEGEGRGFALEAARAARSEARRLWGLGPLISTIRAENARSLALARRLNCVYEGEWQSPFGPLGLWRHPTEAA
jgi:RimJ/RimL family protein N-acetyltransferase